MFSMSALLKQQCSVKDVVERQLGDAERQNNFKQSIKINITPKNSIAVVDYGEDHTHNDSNSNSPPNDNCTQGYLKETISALFYRPTFAHVSNLPVCA